MERLLLEQYNVRMGHCTEKAPDPNPGEKPSVGYHTDEQTLREELKELAGYPGEPSAEDEDEDGQFGV
jgi:hypothetical protein